jgi:hypothetical protein
MLTAIKSDVYPAWYCKECHKAHQILYVNGADHYCPNCLPEELKKEPIHYINQNREHIKN